VGTRPIARCVPSFARHTLNNAEDPYCMRRALLATSDSEFGQGRALQPHDSRGGGSRTASTRVCSVPSTTAHGVSRRDDRGYFVDPDMSRCVLTLSFISADSTWRTVLTARSGNCFGAQV
jgi:hypothetical protein